MLRGDSLRYGVSGSVFVIDQIRDAANDQGMDALVLSPPLVLRCDSIGKKTFVYLV